MFGVRPAMMPWWYAPMLNQPMSSPMMKMTFGRCCEALGLAMDQLLVFSQIGCDGGPLRTCDARRRPAGANLEATGAAPKNRRGGSLSRPAQHCERAQCRPGGTVAARSTRIFQPIATFGATRQTGRRMPDT